jgi:hypothetical protein
VASTLRKAAESGKYIKDEMEGFDGCDIIALATHGRSGLSRLVLGSVTEYLLETTKLPLLIVRPVELKRMRAKLPRDSLLADCVLYSCMWVTGDEIPNGKERTLCPDHRCMRSSGAQTLNSMSCEVTENLSSGSDK